MTRSAVLSVALALATPAAAEPLRLVNGRLFIDAKVNGVKTEALLDSGAEATLVDPLFAARAAIAPGEALTIKGAGGTQPAHLASGVTVEALGQRLARLDVVLVDLGSIRWLVGHPTRVVIGRELFDAAPVEVNIAARTVRALVPGAAGRGVAQALTPHAGIEALAVTVNGVSAAAELDFGNGTEVKVSRTMADRLKPKRLGRVEGGGIGGRISRERVSLAELRIGGRTFRDVPAQVDPLPNAGELNIGTSILRHFIVTADFGHHRVWLQPLAREKK
ncbi:hypothetical protein HMF7854_08430 [Sphingomonas ginkgonis]|uniref:Peptidase A2 domain-containing protein n=1 Tax=Sphingomonas ginkgonis TaxID=2315330 RepID=A0A3R9WNY0_9SPHN|nr:pepsin/retropepsin-like aspartic protease family protein [Sphingomonas ginkgonis]RST30863.1 hypothetical protein HMF7854_08430 [Sphingomonas ginkgonis]